MNKEPLFEAREINKDFPSPQGQILHVLEKINLKIYPNEVVALIGPSGCGKSTLLRILAGLIPQTKGALFYKGHRLHGLLPNMSMVFQSFALYPWMTVRQNIEAVLKAARASVQEMEQKTEEAITLIGLEGFEDAYPREISGGMKQRVGMARALVRNPELLFMDEPFSEVDTFTAEVLRSEVIRIWSNKEIKLSSILLVSHDVHEVAYMADRIIVLGIQPTTVISVIKNKLPRPRNYHSSDFLHLVEKLHDLYSHLSIAKPTVHKEKIDYLVSVTNDEILGFLKYLNRHKAAHDIFQIGHDSNVHVDKLTPILQAAQLLDFIEIQERKVRLTPLANDFLQSNERERRDIWKTQLLTIPIFRKVVDLLKKASHHSLSREQIVHFLSQDICHRDAHVQWHVLLRWGQYGKLFTYHKKTHHISLVNK
jgi:NitT/TauT family transport system ATP-binding protein